MASRIVTKVLKLVAAYGEHFSHRRLFFALSLSTAFHACAVAVLMGLPMDVSDTKPREDRITLSAKLSAGTRSFVTESLFAEGVTDHPENPLVKEGKDEFELRGSPGAKEGGAIEVAQAKNKATIESAPKYYSAEWLERRPIPLFSIVPAYPPDIENVVGRVTLLLLINERGSVDSFRILFSEPPGIFDQESIIAFTQAKYSAGRIAGLPVKSQFVVDIRFDPGEEPKAVPVMEGPLAR